MQAREDRLRSLMLQGLGGNASSYHTLLIELSAHLRSFLRRRLARYPEEIEDLVQELLFAIHTQRHTYDARRPFTAWVHAIARYKLIDLLRRRSRTDLLHDPLDDEREIFAHADNEACEARYDVARLLEALPDRQRLPIQYVKIDGSSVADTARLIGMSESAVKIGIHRGLKLLAQKMRGMA